MCNTRAVHVRRGQYDVLIDRRTRWGNPFPMKSESDRASVIAKYRVWLWAQIKSGKITLEDLSALKGKRLGCHCAPRACHGDILSAAAEWAYARIQKAA